MQVVAGQRLAPESWFKAPEGGDSAAARLRQHEGLAGNGKRAVESQTRQRALEKAGACEKAILRRRVGAVARKNACAVPQG